jgi:hypothetical protein
VSEHDLLTLHFTDWSNIVCLVLLYVCGTWKWFELVRDGAEGLAAWIIKKVKNSTPPQGKDER